MKYMKAFLKDSEKTLTPYSEHPTKPIKPVSSVLSGTSSRSTGKIEGPSSDQPEYREMAESVGDACFTIDSHWLVDRQPDLWQRLCWLDFKALEFERRGETGADYKQVLERIVSTVKEARALYEQERQQGAAVQ